MATPDPFRAIEISRLAHQLKAEGTRVIHMEFGQPSTGAPKSAIAAAHQVLDADAMGYWESSPLCDALAKRYQALHGVDIEPGRIILTCGASPALVLALSSAFQPGDRIAMARPGYVAYRGTVTALNMVPVELACGPASRYQLTAAMIEAMDPAPAGLIIASPANPTGTIIGAEELAAIAAVCKARGIRIVSDEIYHGLSYTGPTHSMLEFDPDALIINSFSKYFSMAGWRLGWLVAPADLREAARAYVSYGRRWSVRGDQVVHHVAFCLLPNWVGTDLVRTVTWSGDDLVLSTAPELDPKGRTLTNRLVWRRAG